MSNNKILKLIENDLQLHNFIVNLFSGYFEAPYIVKGVQETLDDNNPFYDTISDKNKVALCKMLTQYYKTCFDYFVDDLKLNKLLQYGKLEVYSILAVDGYRDATVNEVNNGVRGLIPRDIFTVEEDVYKKLCLLEWTFTGNNYYFRQAGYTLRWSEGKVVESFYDMIQSSANALLDLFNWIDENKLNKAIKQLKKVRQNKGYKYADYDKNEIKESISINQLVINTYKNFPRNSENSNIRRALALSIKTYKNKEKLKPLEISFMRDIYEEFINNKDRSSDEYVSTEALQLKKECEILLDNRYKGIINANHFAYKVIDTLKLCNYTKCSLKQHTIIRQALTQLSKKIDINNNETPDTDEEALSSSTQIISDDDIDSMVISVSDAIGDGLFDN